jgi:hypothetical protein
MSYLEEDITVYNNVSELLYYLSQSSIPKTNVEFCQWQQFIAAE